MVAESRAAEIRRRRRQRPLLRPRLLLLRYSCLNRTVSEKEEVMRKAMTNTWTKRLKAAPNRRWCELLTSEWCMVA